MRTATWAFLLTAAIVFSLAARDDVSSDKPDYQVEPNYEKEEIIQFFNDYLQEFERVRHFFEDSGWCSVWVGRTSHENCGKYECIVDGEKASEKDSAAILAELEAIDYTEWLSYASFDQRIVDFKCNNVFL